MYECGLHTYVCNRFMCMHICMCVCVHSSMYTCVNTYIYTYIYIKIYRYIDTNTYTNVSFSPVYVCACPHVPCMLLICLCAYHKYKAEAAAKMASKPRGGVRMGLSLRDLTGAVCSTIRGLQVRTQQDVVGQDPLSTSLLRPWRYHQPGSLYDNRLYTANTG